MGTVRYINPAWTSKAKPQPNINNGGNATELRQTLGIARTAEIFKRGARRYPICPGCGLEVAPGEERVTKKLGTTPYEKVLILSGQEETIVYHMEHYNPEAHGLLEQLLSQGEVE